jgi:carboxymethylenebutenolidase
VYLYEGADHGFSCDQRPSYNPQAAALARQRTLEFLARYIAGTEPQKTEPGGAARS